MDPLLCLAGVMMMMAVFIFLGAFSPGQRPTGDPTTDAPPPVESKDGGK